MRRQKLIFLTKPTSMGAASRMPCSLCNFSVMRACTLAEVCAMECAQLFSVQSCVLFVWSGPVPTDQNSI